jgi:signal transduction histidine kinase
MVDTVSFQTRARTIDHLGREQIADCPTAISELWKNSFDAYATNVCLNIFDGENKVATLVDDGHGMDIKDLREKWLVVGTESKAINSTTSTEKMNGLTKRPTQGQKGIGRLSSAALGSLLLLITKNKNSPFAACLLDWRLFENPYLMLHDIQIPVIEFGVGSELFDLLPEMFDTLMGNLWGKGDDDRRNERIELAWKTFDTQEKSEDEDKNTTKEKIEKTVINEAFSSRHMESWDVWNHKATHGTAMIMGNINEDLVAQLDQDAGSEADGVVVRAKENFKQTLSNFINPFAKKDESPIENFNASVIAWHGELQRYIVDPVSEFDYNALDNLEHIVEGDIDENGKFTGRIKAFGKWYDNVKIRPKANYKLRKDTRFGPFSLRIGSFEALKNKSIQSDELRNIFISQSEKYGGVMVHRDGLRVMPYGRENSDYFEIEYRRTKNAGRYFFSNRRSFGGISISKAKNPNLRDKAGREGIIDNKASKLLREIVEHILIASADKYLGRKSDNRQIEIEEIERSQAVEKATSDRRKLLRKEQLRVKTAIKKNEPFLIINNRELHELTDKVSSYEQFDSIDVITEFKAHVSRYDSKLKDLSLSPIPRSLGSIESDYRDYRDIELSSKELIKQLDTSLNNAFGKLVVKSDIETAETLLKSKAGVLHARIHKWASEGRKQLKDELLRFDEVVDNRNKAFRNALSESLENLVEGKTPLNDVLQKIDAEYQKQDNENAQTLIPYLTALENIRHQIDLEGLALHSVNEASALKQEVERLNGLAQLGITVEIIGHEIEGLDQTIERGLNVLAEAKLSSREQSSLKSVISAQQSLSDRWRFLSPLKLSGEKVKGNITGDDIFNYVNNFYRDNLKDKNIRFTQTKNFENLSVFEHPSRLYPVFINLLNNARYWVGQNETDNREIVFDYIDGEIFVSDNGPGVDIDDVSSLFTIFFTRKQRGGRGVGLYLCKTNLQAGNHTIRYETNVDKKILQGANFVIGLKGIKNA